MAGADVLLTVGIARTASYQTIDTDLQAIQKHIEGKKLKINVGINTAVKTAWSQQIKSILNGINEKGLSVKVKKVDIGAGAISSFKRQLESVVNTIRLDKGVSLTLKAKDIGEIKKDFDDAGSSADEAARKVGAFKAQMEALGTLKKEVQAALKSLGSGATEEERTRIAEIIAQYNKWNEEILTVKASGTAASAERREALQAEHDAILKNISAIVEERTAQEQSAAATQAAMQQLVSQRQQVQAAIATLGTGESQEQQNKIAAIIAQYQELEAKIKQIEASDAKASKDEIANLREKYSAIMTLITAYRDAEAEKKKDESSEQRRQSLLKQSAALMTQMQNAERNWTKARTGVSSADYAAIRTYIQSLEELRGKLASGQISNEQFASSFKALQLQFTQTAGAIKAVGENTQTAMHRVGSLSEKFGTWFGITRVIMYAVRAVREMVRATIELDSAFAQLKIVTGATDAEMSKFVDTTTQLAKNLGQSVSDVAKSIETFSRLGYDLPDASKLAEFATIMANVASVDISEATTGMTSIIKGFNMDVANTEHVADVLVEVGQKYAVSASELMEAYEKSGAALNATNTSFEKSVGLIAAANASVQNASTVGTALKTVSARIRGSKTDLEELGEGVEDLADGFSKYAKEIKALTGFDIMVEGTTDQFKDLYDIMEGIAGVWDRLSDTQQARVAEILGGTRQLQVIASIIGNWSDAVDAYATAMDAAGAATEANNIYMKTAAAHINQFKATFQQFASTLLSSRTVSTIVDIGTGILSLITALQKIHVLLPLIIASIVLIKAHNIAKIAAESAARITTLSAKIVAEKGATDTLTASVAALSLAEKKKLKTEIESAVVTGALTKEEGQQIISALGLTAADGALVAANKGLAASFKSVMASVPVWGWIALGISVVIEAISALTAKTEENAEAEKQAAEEAKQKQEEARKAAYEAGAAAEESAKNILTMYAAFETAAIGTGEFKSALLDLANALDVDVSDSLDKVIAKVRELTDQELQQAITKTWSATQEAMLAFDQAAEDYFKTGTRFNTTGYDAWSGAYLNVGGSYFGRSEVEQITNGAVTQRNRGYLSSDEYYHDGMPADERPTDVVLVKNTESLREYYEGLVALQKAYQDLAYELERDYGSDPSAIFDSTEYKAISQAISDLSSQYDTLIAQESAYTRAVATQAIRKDIQELKIDSQGAFDEYIAGIRNSTEYTDAMKAAMEQVASDIFPQFSSAASTSADQVSTAINDLQKSVFNVKSAYDILAKATGEMAANGGLSADTIKELAGITEDYLDFLYEEDGKIKLNTDAWREYADGGVRDRISSLQTEITALKDERDLIEETNRLLLDKSAELEDLAIQYQSLVNGNVDFSRLPANYANQDAIVEQFDYYKDYPNTAFLYDIGEGEAKYTIEVTPVLEDGTVMTSESLAEYVNGLVTDAGVEGILASDLANIVVTVQNGTFYDDVEYWSNLHANIDKITREYGAIIAELESATGMSFDEIMATLSDTTGTLDELKSSILENESALSILSELFDELAGSTNAYAEALSQFSTVDAVIDGVSSKLQTLADLQNAVKDSFTMSLEEALKFAEVYPEILNNAVPAANGQITLNEDVVNSFIEGKEHEIQAQVDSKIAQLKADRDVLDAKLAMAQAELDLAQSVGEGEGKITQEEAEYRINVGNSVAEALIANGVDEATAYQLAAAAMSKNFEEFDRIAMQVATDVDGNLNKAAYEAALGIYKNMNSAKLDIASLARQAQNAARAIAAMKNGEVAGSSALQGGSGGGGNYSSYSMNLTAGSFNGTNYSYTPQKVSLDKFISDLELDISSYKSAIAQIDGQIAALQALRNKDLGSFKSDKTSASSGSGSGKSGSGKSGSGSSSSSKEKSTSWFEQEYKLHNHLMKMDAENMEDYVAWLNEAFQKAYKQGIITLDDYYKYQEEVYDKLKDLFRDYLNDTEHQIYLLEQQRAQGRDIDKIIAYYRELMDAVKKESIRARRAGLTEEDDYIQELQKKYREYYDAIAEARSKWFDELLADEKFSIDRMTDVGADSNKIVNAWKSIISSIKRELDWYLANGYKMTDDVVQELLKELWSARDEIISIANSVVDGIQNVYKTFTDAATEWATTGYLSVDSMQAILELGPKYLKFLYDENGQLKLNEQALQNVLAAKTEELATDTAMTYVKQVLEAAQRKDIDTLIALTDVNSTAAASSWDLVYATLAMARAIGVANGIESKYFDDALDYVNKIKSLSKTAIDSIADYYKTLDEGYISQADALDKLIDYTKQLIKWENEQQVQALRDQVDAYKEIIEAKKEALRLSKEQEEHDKSVAEKIEEIAKLQARIDLLALDDSREANAERAKLEEELAEKQKALAEEQNNYAYEQQTEALDKSLEEFENEKNAEIDVLSSMYDSEEKLYQAAIDRIQNGWGTLYEQLIAWNTEYGSELNKHITSAWNAAADAVSRYGSFLDALIGTDSHVDIGPYIDEYGDGGNTSTEEGILAKMRQNAVNWWGATDEQRSGLHRQSMALAQQYQQLTGKSLHYENGTWYTEDGQRAFTTVTKDEIIQAIIAAMKRNGKAWGSADKETRQYLSDANLVLGARLAKILNADVHRENGTWYIGNRLLFDVDHSGGVAGNKPTLKQNEVMAVLKKGEAVLDENREKELYRVIDFVQVLSDRLGKAINPVGLSRMSGSLVGIPTVPSPSVSTDGSRSFVFSPSIQVAISHNGAMSDLDARRYGNEIAEVALGKLSDAFAKRGINSIGNAMLKQ